MLKNLKDLNRDCTRPPGSHVPCRGAEVTKAAAKYTPALCDAYVKLVLDTWERNATIEWAAIEAEERIKCCTKLYLQPGAICCPECGKPVNKAEESGNARVSEERVSAASERARVPLTLEEIAEEPPWAYDTDPNDPSDTVEGRLVFQVIAETKNIPLSSLIPVGDNQKHRRPAAPKEKPVDPRF